MTEDEFVAFELESIDRHEFIDGITRAMTGASIRHNDVALNLAIALRAAAKGTGCKVNIEGVRLKVNSKRHYYPDVVVTCEDPSDTHAHSAPCLIAEVLSPTTTSIDRGEKRLAYMAMPSLRHFLLIDLVVVRELSSSARDDRMRAYGIIWVGLKPRRCNSSRA